MDEINLKKCYQLFNEYVKKFDLSIEAIDHKFHHTYRVIYYAKEISHELKLTKKETDFVCLCALLHDIGRFEQWKKYQTFSDSRSTDHASLGIEILMKENYIDEYIQDPKWKDFLFKTIANHNKYQIEDQLTKQEKLFCNIVRDADKIDIMLRQGKHLIQKDFSYKRKLFEQLLKGKLIENKDVENELDSIFRLISFLFDIHFKYTFKILKENNFINEKLSLLEPYMPYSEIEELRKYCSSYIEEQKENH